jgi:hypothetical protein
MKTKLKNPLHSELVLELVYYTHLIKKYHDALKELRLLKFNKVNLLIDGIPPNDIPIVLKNSKPYIKLSKKITEHKVLIKSFNRHMSLLKTQIKSSQKNY